MTAISSANPAASGINTATAATQIRPAAVVGAGVAAVEPEATLKSDTVKLSLAANIKLLHHQGMSPSGIAARLGLSVKLVDGYIPGSTSTAATAAPAIPSSSGKSTEVATAVPIESSAEQGSSTPAPPPAAGTQNAPASASGSSMASGAA
ncbi:MAG TPA: hypothetical protein VGT08_08340 [Terracidiphilus sp.]|nr:hypothetical protein [Terracidiphilus sp.]